MALLVFVGLMLISVVVCAGLARRVAEQKGRPPEEGYWLGMLFGVVGLVCEALLPDRS